MITKKNSTKVCKLYIKKVFNENQQEKFSSIKLLNENIVLGKIKGFFSLVKSNEVTRLKIKEEK